MTDKPGSHRRGGARSDDAAIGRAHNERSYMSELGHRLRTLREERGLTQQQLARAAGIATDMVSRLENGHYSSPGLRTLLRIAEGMGMGVAALLPDLAGTAYTTPEQAHRARLNALLHRVSPDELELCVDLVAAVVQRKRGH